MGKFEIKETFYLNGEEFKMISGTVHYFRIVPEYWHDRLNKLKLMGCNTVETYIPWNFHEPQKGQFEFEGQKDFERFIEIATELGLYIIMRPSPYICAEWEFGGLPYWLLKDTNIRLRSTDKRYLEHVSDFFSEIIPKLVKHQITNGGNILMMQIENEYGYYSDDKDYLIFLKNLMIDLGVDVPLVTSDGPWNDALESGNIMSEGVLETLNFGSKTEEHYQTFKSKFPSAPFMCMEFWVGWFDAYGGGHNVRNAKECANELDEILKRGHVNIFVAAGGTNFGYTNGANNFDQLQPLITSYDYDAPISEDGTLTEKFYEFQKVIAKYNSAKNEDITINENKCVAYNKVQVANKFDFFGNLDNISTRIDAKYPLSFECLDQENGYVYYQTQLTSKREIKLKLQKAADRIQVYQDQRKLVSTLYDRELNNTVSYDMENESEQIGILTESLGRVNFNTKIDFEQKGIAHSILINDVIKTNIEHYKIDFHNLEGLSVENSNDKLPTISKFELIIDDIHDTYIDISGFGKGVVIINGEILGRYWNRGPQMHMYLPGPKLKLGLNNIYIFETEGVTSDFIEFHSEPRWSKVIDFK